MIIAPGEPIGTIEALGVTLDPIALAVAVLVAQQRQIADFLLGHELVAVGQHQETARMLQAAREQCGFETLGHARGLAVIFEREWPIAHDWAGSWWRQILWFD